MTKPEFGYVPTDEDIQLASVNFSKGEQLDLLGMSFQCFKIWPSRREISIYLDKDDSKTIIRKAKDVALNFIREELAKYE